MPETPRGEGVGTVLVRRVSIDRGAPDRYSDRVPVLGVCSLKGGVGKTSVTLGLTSAALHAGLRTLVVDLDPQADTTLALGATATFDVDSATGRLRDAARTVLASEEDAPARLLITGGVSAPGQPPIGASLRGRQPKQPQALPPAPPESPPAAPGTLDPRLE